MLQNLQAQTQAAFRLKDRDYKFPFNFHKFNDSLELIHETVIHKIARGTD